MRVIFASSRVSERVGPRCVRAAEVADRNTRPCVAFAFEAFEAFAFKETTAVIPVSPRASVRSRSVLFLVSIGPSSRFRNCTATWHASAIGICSTRLPE